MRKSDKGIMDDMALGVLYARLAGSCLPETIKQEVRSDYLNYLSYNEPEPFEAEKDAIEEAPPPEKASYPIGSRSNFPEHLQSNDFPRDVWEQLGDPRTNKKYTLSCFVVINGPSIEQVKIWVFQDKDEIGAPLPLTKALWYKCFFCALALKAGESPDNGYMNRASIYRHLCAFNLNRRRDGAKTFRCKTAFPEPELDRDEEPKHLWTTTGLSVFRKRVVENLLPGFEEHLLNTGSLSEPDAEKLLEFRRDSYRISTPPSNILWGGTTRDQIARELAWEDPKPSQ